MTPILQTTQQRLRNGLYHFLFYIQYISHSPISTVRTDVWQFFKVIPLIEGTAVYIETREG